MQGLQPLIVPSTVDEPIVSPPVRDGCAQENEWKSYSRNVFPFKNDNPPSGIDFQVLLWRATVVLVGLALLKLMLAIQISVSTQRILWYWNIAITTVN